MKGYDSMKSENKPTSVRLPRELDKKLSLKAHLLSIERKESVSKNRLIVEILSKELGA